MEAVGAVWCSCWRECLRGMERNELWSAVRETFAGAFGELVEAWVTT